MLEPTLWPIALSRFCVGGARNRHGIGIPWIGVILPRPQRPADSTPHQIRNGRSRFLTNWETQHAYASSWRVLHSVC
jgi:hypothetical protein